MNIVKTALAAEHTAACPSCGYPLLRTQATSCKVIGQRYWLRDGDTVGGLHKALTAAQKTPDGFHHELLVGDCPECYADYYVVEAAFMPGDRADVQDCLLENEIPATTENFLCRLGTPVDGLPSEWLMAQTTFTDIPGIAQRHLFGPWKLEDTLGVVGQHGVSSNGGGTAEPWAHARTILIAYWDAMRTLNKKDNT